MDLPPTPPVDTAAAERSQPNAARRDKMEKQAAATEYVDFEVVTDAQLLEFDAYTSGQSSCDFVNFREQATSFRMNKASSIAQLVVEIEARLGVPREYQRLWTCALRENRTTRPDRCLTILGFNTRSHDSRTLLAEAKLAVTLESLSAVNDDGLPTILPKQKLYVEVSLSARAQEHTSSDNLLLRDARADSVPSPCASGRRREACGH